MGQETGKYVFDYAVDFHRKYKGKAKYSYNVLIDGHEWSTFVPKFLDSHFLRFLKTLESESIFEDTLVLLLSDHG